VIYDVTTDYITKSSGMRSIRRAELLCQNNVDVILRSLLLSMRVIINLYRVVNKRENIIRLYHVTATTVVTVHVILF